jgi:hypothetical protein
MARFASCRTPGRTASPTSIVIGTYTDLSGVTAVWGVNDVNAYRSSGCHQRIELRIRGEIDQAY